MNLKRLLTLLCALPMVAMASATTSDSVLRNEENGKLYWADTKEDAYFFGVNYIAGFSGPYDQILEKGIDIKDVIDSDVYHISRMGLNAFRIHVWDYEISDINGNLKVNHHLEMLDYLIYKLEERGIYVLLTPVYYDGGSKMAYPYKGFSKNYLKNQAHINKASVEAHRNYYKQFVSHINPYTKKAYKDDPMVVGFEVCNEPGEHDTPSAVKFASEMRKAFRETGCTKPIYYNSTTVREKAIDILKTDIDGGTYQWYPAGLRISRGLKANYLPHVEKYNIPFINNPEYRAKARAIYEFDAADVIGSYIYPAMAMSFKEAGMMWATMFSYEPMPLAPSNTSYYTHYMNLAYSPSKAISLMIAGEVFNNPKYSRNRKGEKSPFESGDFKIDYTKNLSEIASKDKFYYTTSTKTPLKDEKSLKKVAGYGSSPVVDYKGEGVYFLDKVEEGVWRLEVMPDAIAIKDPHSNPAISSTKTIIRWNMHTMKVALEELGNDFAVKAINSGNNYFTKAQKGKFAITPGVYILSKGEVDNSIGNKKLGTLTLNEFHAPKREDNEDLIVVHTPKELALEGTDVKVEVKIVSDKEIKKVTLINPTDYNPSNSVRQTTWNKMEKSGLYDYSATIDGKTLKSGIYNYLFLIDFCDGKQCVMPGGEDDRIGSLTYYKFKTYSMDVVAKDEAVELFYGGDLDQTILYIGKQGYNCNVAGGNVAGEARAQFGLSSAWAKGIVNGSGVYSVIEEYIAEKMENLAPLADTYDKIVIKGKSLETKATTLDVILVDNDGNGHKASVKLGTKSGNYSIKLNSLKPSAFFLLPRPFPGIYGAWWSSETTPTKALDLSKIERIQVLVPEKGNVEKPKFEISSIVLK